MEPTQRALAGTRESVSRSQPGNSAVPRHPTPTAINLREGGSLADIQAVEILGDAEIEEVVRRVLLGETKELEERQFFCFDPMQIEQLQWRLKQEMDNRLEQEAHDFLFKGTEFTVKKELKPWKNHQARVLKCIESTDPLPLSKIPPALITATKGMVSDEVTLLRACIIQLIFDCHDLKDLSQKGIIKLKFPFNTFITLAAVLHSTPKAFWDGELLAERGVQENAKTSKVIVQKGQKESTVLLLKILSDSMKSHLSNALPQLIGKSKTILQGMLNKLETLDTIAWDKTPFPFANLRATLGCICHDKREPLFEQSPLEFLTTAKDMLYKVKKFTAHVLGAWESVGGSCIREAGKRLDLALRRIDQAIKKQLVSPLQLSNLYKNVTADMILLKVLHTELLNALPLHTARLAPFWGIDSASLYEFFGDEEGGKQVLPEDDELALQKMYAYGLAKLSHESIDLPCFTLLRAFERSLAARGVEVTAQQINSFKEPAEEILAVFETLCQKHPLLQEKVIKILGSKFSLLDLIGYQRDELKIIEEVRLGAFAALEKVYYFGHVLIDRFEQIIVPFLNYKTKILVERLPNLSESEAQGTLNQEELSDFRELLVAVDEFLYVVEHKLPALDVKLNEMFNLIPKKGFVPLSGKHKKMSAGKTDRVKNDVGKKPLQHQAATKDLSLATSQKAAGNVPDQELSSQPSNSKNPVPETVPTSTLPAILEPVEKKIETPDEKKPEIVVKEYVACRKQFLQSAKKLKEHIKERARQDQVDAAAGGDYKSLRNVHWKELVKELTAAGWALVKAGGGHLQYKHPYHIELGRATVPSGSKDALSIGVVKNVRDQIYKSKVQSDHHK